MVLLPANPPRLRDEFEQRMGYRPAVLRDVGSMRFMIINRSTLVTSWPAHKSALWPRGRGQHSMFWSTMCSVSENPGHIHDHVGRFASMWGQYQLSRLSSLSREIPALAWQVLNIIAATPKPWTAKMLVEGLADHGAGKRTVKEVRDAVSILLSHDLVWSTEHGEVVRDRTAHHWQTDWLERFEPLSRG